MAKAKKPAAVVAVSFAVQTLADGTLVGKTSEKGKKYLVQRDGATIATFQMYKQAIQIDTLDGVLTEDEIGDIANSYYDWKDEQDRIKARAKRSAAKREGETKEMKTVARRKPQKAVAQQSMVM